MLSTESARKWADGEDVGVYGTVDAGHDRLALLVEKEFACLDGKDEDNEDTFANPKSNAAC